MSQVKEITSTRDSLIKYSICTFVTRKQQYMDMVKSFINCGFVDEDCEYLYIDNSVSNKYEGFSGVNRFLTSAGGDYIIICHQDILLTTDNREKLDSIIAELDRIDPQWGLFGNVGGIYPWRLAMRITDPHGEDQSTPQLPTRVCSLDENFIVLRREANLAASRDISGFHLYGTDLCVIADILGYNSYVVDFHLSHASRGNKDGFEIVRSRLIEKYAWALRSRIITTPSTLVVLRKGRTMSRVLNSRAIAGIARHVGLIAWHGGRPPRSA